MKTIQLLLEDLKLLGDTEDKVAFSIFQLGIKGNISSGRTCPIAQYLRTKGWSPTVGDKLVDVQHEINIQIPQIIAHFIKKFDDGEYPLLCANYKSYYPTFTL